MRVKTAACNAWLVTTTLTLGVTIGLPFSALASDMHRKHSAVRFESASHHSSGLRRGSGHVFSASFVSGTAFRHTPFAYGGSHLPYGHMVVRGAYRFVAGRGGYGRVASGGGGIQCVTFARAATGIELSGNASDWWDNAAGLYQRGARPEVGSVLNFRANGRMRMGHVAVVTAVLNGRSVEIDHANWSGPGAVRGGVSRAITVVDVSPENDWSAVRVELGHSEEYGSVYPTYGFIYNRPDGSPAPTGTMVASAAPIPRMNPPPADLRPSSQRVAGRLSRNRFEEVAEAPAPRQLELNFGPTPVSDTAGRTQR